MDDHHLMHIRKLRDQKKGEGRGGGLMVMPLKLEF